uniref:Uncharacterized protein n=1 Tax=Sus scrofa TaxID=9823 RepID=A0A8D1BY83_PIG
MRPVDADGERAPDDDDWARPPSPVLLADGRDVAALEREHVRAHLRARRRLREIEGLLDEMKSEVEASEAGALDPAGSAGAAAEARVVKLCEEVERKAVEAALMGRRIVELHRQMDGSGCY